MSLVMLHQGDRDRAPRHGGHARDAQLPPPAGIDPLVVVVNDLSWSFLVAPVAVGVCLLAAVAFLWHNLFRRGSWPARWW